MNVINKRVQATMFRNRTESEQTKSTTRKIRHFDSIVLTDEHHAVGIEMEASSKAIFCIDENASKPLST